MQLTPDQLRGNGKYYFDEEAGFRPVRFIERFCRHADGKPFKLEPVQRRIIRDVFGWKEKATDLRRFTDVYWEAAVGAGKSPTAAGIGLYMLMADGEQEAQIYSIASTYQQSKIVFEFAKGFVARDPDLSARLDVTQYEIKHPSSRSYWRVVSGKGPGAGCRPTCILPDELHQWKNAEGYHDLRGRMGKRRQPLLFAMTNAGTSRASFCYQLREQAMKTLKGKGRKRMYPVIWANEDPGTPEGRIKLAGDPAAWKRANPMIGVTMTERAIRDNYEQAIDSPDPEDFAKFLRNHLSIWPGESGTSWLDLSLWGLAERLYDVAPSMVSPALYVGADLSECDDLSAVVMVWATSDMYYVTSHFWIPRCKAEEYERKTAVPYSKWAAARHITLLDGRTVSDEDRRGIAKAIVKMAAEADAPIKAVCYDPYKADVMVAELEAAGVVCTPVQQGAGISRGSNELDRRVKEGMIAVEANPVMRFCAENARIRHDERGNVILIKPNAEGKYAGRRGAKIDGIAALATALTLARTHKFPAKAEKWKGEAWSM